MRISDISVSRLHAKLQLIKGKVYLQDKDSKFGTLVQMTDPVDMCKVKNLKVQSGRTTIKVSVKKSWNIFFPCFGGGLLYVVVVSDSVLGGIDLNKRAITNDGSSSPVVKRNSPRNSQN